MHRRHRGNFTKWYRAILYSPESARQDLAEAHLVYETAVEQGARVYAFESLHEAGIFLECGEELYLESKFLEARILAKLAQQKGDGARALAQQSKAEVKKQIQKQMQSISEEIRSIEAFVRDFPRTSPICKVGQEWDMKIRSAMTDFSNALLFLKTNDFNSAQAHLGHTRALLEHLKKEVEGHKHNPSIGVRDQVASS